MKEIMAKTTTSKTGVFDVSGTFGEFRFPGFDNKPIVEAQRKNLEALTQANQLAVEGVQALARRQTEIIQHAIVEASGLLSTWTLSVVPEDRLAKHADVAQLAFEKGLAHVRELNDLTVKTSTDVFGIIARRVSETFDEVRLYAKKQAAAE